MTEDVAALQAGNHRADGGRIRRSRTP
jgi:hypothetical protein